MNGFPSADQVARAIVTANRLIGENAPMATCMRQKSRARNVALAALISVYPQPTQQCLSRLVGYPNSANGASTLIMARKSKWWNEDWVDEIVGELIGEEGLA